MVPTETCRCLTTSHILSAKLEFRRELHHLQIQLHKGGGNIQFIVSPLGSFTQDGVLVVRALEHVYGTNYLRLGKESPFLPEDDLFCSTRLKDHYYLYPLTKASNVRNLGYVAEFFA